jgi:hypothetical protein
MAYARNHKGFSEIISLFGHWTVSFRPLQQFHPSVSLKMTSAASYLSGKRIIQSAWSDALPSVTTCLVCRPRRIDRNRWGGCSSVSNETGILLQ